MRSVAATLLLGTILAGSPASAEWSADHKKDMVAAFLKFGVSVGSTLVPHLSGKAPPLDQEQLPAYRQAIEASLQPYLERKRRAEITFGLARSYTDLLIEGTAVAATASGVGAIPALIGRTVAQTGMDALWSAAENASRKNGLVLLKAAEGDLLELAGGNFETLKQMDIDSLRQKIKAQPEIFGEIKSVLGNDKDAAERIVELTIKTLQTTDQAIFENVSINSGGIAANAESLIELDTQLTSFMGTVSVQFDAQNRLIEKIEQRTEDLENSVTTLNTRLGKNEAATQFLIEYSFKSMPPREKARLLSAGHLDHRFAGDTETKQALIEKLEAEADILELSQDFANAAATAQNVATILDNLGVELPEPIADAVQFSAVASKAFSQFATGNYLGAVVSLTGVFKKRADPDAERFKILMGYLDKQFKQINKKLNRIIKLQISTLKAIDELAQRMEVHFNRLDSRVARVEFQVNEIAGIVREKHVEDWVSCFNMVDIAKQQFPGQINRDFPDFTSSIYLLNFLKGSGQEAAERCREYILEDVSFSADAIDTFGSLLDAGKMRKIMQDRPDRPAAAGQHSPSDLEFYRTQQYRPSIEVLRSAAKHYGLKLPQVVDFLVRPTQSLYQLEERVEQSVRDRAPCDAADGSIDGYLTASTQKILCFGTSADAGANSLLGIDVVPDFSLRSADWFWIASRVADFYDKENNRFVDEKAVFEFARRTVGVEPDGRRIAEVGLNALDIGIMSFPILYGELLALYGNEVLFSDVDIQLRPKVTALLHDNPFLQRNVLMVSVMRRLRGQEAELSVGQKQRYRFAFNYAFTAKREPFLFLSKLIGNRAYRLEKEKGQITVLLVPSSDGQPEIRTTLPNPELVSDASLIYPERLALLARHRERLAERLEGYDFLKQLSPQQQELISVSIARSEQQQ